MTNEPVTLNGRYQLLQRIGSGGMSIVYKAQDLSLGRLVAVKMLHESLTDDEGFLRRFQHEAHAAANLTHPNIVTVHDIGRDSNRDRHRHYIVMEYVEGKTLKEIVREQYAEDGRFMPISRALDLAIQICSGIGYAHRADLVHCDVKPQNVLVTRDDRVKVADFGIARAISQATAHHEKQVWGTPQYFAPEQAAGDPLTPASDVYAIGVILFELLSGRLPFRAESHTALALKHLQEKPPAITEFNPTVPRQIEQIIKKILSKEPAGRYRTAGQLGRILGSYRQNSLQETGPFYPAMTTRQQTSQSSQPISEQKTQVYRRRANDATEDTPSSTRPRREIPRRAAIDGRTDDNPPLLHVPANAAPETDWTAVALGIVALITLLGLVPLWYFVYRAWAG